jgi:hypothetical protein
MRQYRDRSLYGTHRGRHTHFTAKNVKEKTYHGQSTGVAHDFTFRQPYSLSKSVWGALGDTEDKIMNVVWGGISQGRDVRSVATDLMAYLKGGPKIVKGRWGKLEPGTKEYAKRLGSKGVDYRAMRIYRSEIHRNQQEAAVTEGEDNPACTGEYDWILMPGRGTFMCDCPKIAEGGPYTKETIPDYPHPNCDCMVEPRLRDSDDLIRDLKDYVNGVPSEGANEISLWAQEHGLGEDGLEIIPPRVQPTGLEADIDNELRNLLNYGLVTGKEHISFMTDDGMKITTRHGKKGGYIVPGSLIEKLKEYPDNSIIMLHNHPTGGSFSGEDLFDMFRMKSIKEIRVIGHTGRTYRMAVGNGIRPPWTDKAREDFLIDYGKILVEKVMTYFGSGIDIDTLIYYTTNETNIEIKNKWNWIYKDGKLNGR